MLPMEKGCASGQTGICVNDRELHEKDLEILAKRGLPRTSGMSYGVDMQGNVWDKASGHHLKNLGKLAPTLVYTYCFVKSLSLLILNFPNIPLMLFVCMNSLM